MTTVSRICPGHSAWHSTQYLKRCRLPTLLHRTTRPSAKTDVKQNKTENLELGWSWDHAYAQTTRSGIHNVDTCLHTLLPHRTTRPSAKQYKSNGLGQTAQPANPNRHLSSTRSHAYNDYKIGPLGLLQKRWSWSNRSACQSE
jgi:hypothetical protein